MLGALAAATGLLSLDTLEAVFAERFPDDAQANLAAARAAAVALGEAGRALSRLAGGERLDAAAVLVGERGVEGQT